MKKETYGIIGLGRFGSVLAKELIDQGKRVIVSDINEEAVKELQDHADFAYILDSTHTIALKEAGYANADVVILSIGENLESSILTFMALKEIGVKISLPKQILLHMGKFFQNSGLIKLSTLKKNPQSVWLKFLSLIQILKS